MLTQNSVLYIKLFSFFIQCKTGVLALSDILNEMHAKSEHHH